MASKVAKIRCGFCNKKVDKTRDWHKFCSEECRKLAQKAGYLPAAALERLVKKFVLRWVDGIIDREIAKVKAKLEAEFEAKLHKEVDRIDKQICDLQYEKVDRDGLHD
jgi:hypothetical protein